MIIPPCHKETTCNYASVRLSLQPVAKYNQLERVMAKLIMWNLTTLDGLIEGPGRDLSWHDDVWGEELDRLSMEQVSAAGALLFGRVTYELMANYWPNASGEIAGFMNAQPKHVFSRTLTSSTWNNTTLYSGDAPATVARLKQEATKDIYLFGSADLASHLIPHGLFDEFRICVVPVLLGGGTPLFKQTGGKCKLKLLDTKALSTGGALQRYVRL
jgi:dihydrofolate reductase